jgi:phosphate transport system substrate-binding protein
MKISLIKLFFFLFLMVAFTACRQQVAKDGEDKITYGKAIIVADESLYPIVDDEHQIFSNNYNRAKIDIVYKPQIEVLNQFLNDTIDIAILPRKLTDKEAKVYEDRKIIVRQTKFAIDGIALITGKSNTDTLITVKEIIGSLRGQINKDKIFVFDNPNSSTVEYLMKLSGVKEFPKNIYALKTNADVIKYVKENPKTIGIVSVAWIKRPTPEVADDVNSVKFLSVKAEGGDYEKPSQSNLKLSVYPLTRDLYIINCQGKAGLGTGFAAFVASELGQRIILKSGLAPDSLPSRQIRIRN